jgi:hypothetical protein
LTEFMPYAEAMFNISTDKSFRAIGGISRGGFWAFNIAFRFPQMFNAVGGHSAFFDPGHFPAEYNPLDLARTAAGIDTLRIWLDRGVDDYAFYGLDLMNDALRTRGVPFEYIIYPEGTHEDAYWSDHLTDYLTFYTQEWQTVTLPLVNNTFDVSHGDLFLPVVAFESYLDDISHDRLLRILGGELDFALTLSQSTVATLASHDVTINPYMTVVPDEELLPLLRANPDHYTLIPFDQLSPALRPLTVDQTHPLEIDLTTYPFIFPAEDGSYDDSQIIRAMYTGVTAITRHTADRIDANGIEWAISGILPLVTQADLLHISNEVSFAERCPASDQPVLGGFCSKDAHFPVLERLGVDVVELSGNHNMDYNASAYLHTLDLYAAGGMGTVGGGATLAEAQHPLIVEINGTRVGHLACNWPGPEYAHATDTTPGAAPCDFGWLESTLATLRNEVDVVVVSMQYAEYTLRTPTPDHVEDMRRLADFGADVVLGTQAHITQAFEIYEAEDGRKVFIHYGLGNFIFDQTSEGFTDFVVDEVIIFEGDVLTTFVHTGTIEDQARPRIMTTDEREAFLMMLRNASMAIVGN